MEKKNKILIAIAVTLGVILIVVIGIIQMNGNNSQEIQQEKTKKQRNVEMQYNEAINFGDKMELTISNSTVDRKILPSNPDSYYYSYTAEEGKEYVIISANVKNIYSNNIRIDDTIEYEMLLDDVKYDSTCYIESSDKGDVQQAYFEDIAPLETRLTYFAIQASEDTISNSKEVKLIITYDNKKYEYSAEIVKEKEESTNNNSIIINDNGTELKLNEEVEVEGNCKFTIKSVSFANEILPPNPTGYYSYLKSEDGKVYLDIIIDVTNLNSKGVRQDKMLGISSILYNDKYEYKVSKVVEEKNGEDLNTYTSIYDIDPLTTLTYHVVAQLPENIQNGSETLELKININNQKYYLKIR